MARKKKPAPEPDPDRPMDEEQWEALLKESDLKAARFGEILETVHDHPDRDDLIARHMGWDRPDDAEGDDEGDPGFDAAAIMEEAAAEVEAEKAERERLGQSDADDDDDPFAEIEREERQIPAYKLANDVGLRMHEALQPFMKARVPDDPEEWDRDEIDERLGEAYIGCMIAAAKIVGGHAMGYEDDVICGNIANVKRGMAAAEKAEAALLWLRDERALPADLVETLLPDVRAVIEAVKGHIETLRARVWWRK